MAGEELSIELLFVSRVDCEQQNATVAIIEMRINLRFIVGFFVKVSHRRILWQKLFYHHIGEDER